MKAKIQFKLGVWWCTKDGVTGWGDNPAFAYKAWSGHMKNFIIDHAFNTVN